MQCGSNVAELLLDSVYKKSFQVSVERVLEILGDFKKLKQLDINGLWRKQNQIVVFVDNVFERLPGLVRLRVSSKFFDVISNFDLELVPDPTLPCVSSLLGNLRKVKVRIHEFDKRKITIMDKWLKNASALEIMEVELPCLSKELSFRGTVSSAANSFLKKLVNLRGGSASTTARICVSF